MYWHVSLSGVRATKLSMINVVHLFVSAGHNFFGHHGQPPGISPMLEVDTVECVAGKGIRGDRFFGFKENYKGQITFFSTEVFDAFRRDANLPEAKPSGTRRNVFVQGIDLNSLIGREFEVQGIRFFGVEHCAPCHWMDLALGAGAEHWLQGRGGLRARVF